MRSALVARPDDLSVAEAVVAGIGARHTENPLRASLHVGEPSPSGAEWILPLEFRVPYESLASSGGGNVARGALVLHAAAGAPGGAASPVTVQRAPVETGADAALAGTSFTYATSLRVRAGTQVLSLALTERDLAPDELRPDDGRHRPAPVRDARDGADVVLGRVPHVHGRRLPVLTECEGRRPVAEREIELDRRERDEARR